MIDYILNKNKGKTSIDISVTGCAIGNGWFHPYYQYSIAQAAYGAGLIDLAQKRSLDMDERKCQGNLEKKKYNTNICWNIGDTPIHESAGHGSLFKVSLYDTRRYVLSGQFPPGKHVVEAYLGGIATEPSFTASKQVLAAIHATQSLDARQMYKECTDPPYFALAHQDGLGVVDKIVRSLDSGVRFLFFNGINDLICNHVGNEIALEKLPWRNIKKWQRAERYAWSPKKSNPLDPSGAAGFMKEYENLQFLKVMEAGHMVPLDQPEIALKMMKTFIYRRSFHTKKQELKSVNNNDESCPSCPSCEVKQSANLQLIPPDTSSLESTTDVTQMRKKVMFGVVLAMIGSASIIYAYRLVQGKNTSGQTIYTSVVPNEIDPDSAEDSLESEYGETSVTLNKLSKGYRRSKSKIQMQNFS